MDSFPPNSASLELQRNLTFLDMNSDAAHGGEEEEDNDQEKEKKEDEENVGQVSSASSPCQSGYVVMRNFDMNSLPTGAEDDGSGTSSAISMVSSMATPEDNFSGFLVTNHDNTGQQQQPNANGGAAGTPRKKLRLSKEQAALLEENFRQHQTLNPKQKNALAKQLNLKSRQVEVWFQNRRARTKLKQTEVDCELLKHCCESLTEENRRLKREMEELRAIKGGGGGACIIGQDVYMPLPLPAATLTLCPSCERVGTRIDRRAFHSAKPQPQSYCLTTLRHPSAASC